MSAVFTALAIGIYQSYLGFIIGLAIMLPILQLLRGEKIKEVLIDILYSMIGVGLGVIVYYGMVQISLRVIQVTMASYKGANEVGILSVIKALPNTILETYQTFFSYFWGEKIIKNANYGRGIFYTILFGFSILVLTVKMIKLKEDRIKRIFLILVGLILVPIGLDIVEIIVPTANVYILMCYQYTLILVFCISLLELRKESMLLSKLFIIGSILIICWTYYLADNASYTAIKITQNQAQATANRIVDRIEQHPEYKQGMKLCIVGHVNNENLMNKLPVYTGTYGGLTNKPIFHGTWDGERGTWIKFFNTYLGFLYEVCSQKEYEEIISSEQFEKMKVYPEEDSVKVINGIMVVKLTNNPAQTK